MSSTGCPMNSEYIFVSKPAFIADTKYPIGKKELCYYIYPELKDIRIHKYAQIRKNHHPGERCLRLITWQIIPTYEIKKAMSWVGNEYTTEPSTVAELRKRLDLDNKIYTKPKRKGKRNWL